MKKIILDTNALLAIGQFKIDLFEELDRICLFKFKIYILDKSIDELNKIIKEQGGKDKAAAKLALGIVKNLDVLETGTGKVDDLLIKRSDMGDYVITQDKELKKKIKHLITIRKKKCLMFV